MNSIELPVETQKFMNDIQTVFKTIFPNSAFFISFDNNLCPCISIYFYLSKDKTETSGNILHNDCCRTVFQSYTVDQNGKLFDKIEFERIYGAGIIRIAHKDNPKEQYCSFGMIPVKFRKLNNSKEKVIEGFKRYVKNLGETILNNAEDINNGIVHNLFDCKTKVNIID